MHPMKFPMCLHVNINIYIVSVLKSFGCSNEKQGAYLFFLYLIFAFPCPGAVRGMYVAIS